MDPKIRIDLNEIIARGERIVVDVGCGGRKKALAEKIGAAIYSLNSQNDLSLGTPMRMHSPIRRYCFRIEDGWRKY